MAKGYLVTKNFDFAPRGNVVLAFKKGQKRSNLTRACIAKGKSLDALEPITKKEND